MRIVFLSHLDTNLYLFRLPVMKEMVLRGHEVIALCPKGVYFDQFEDHGIKAVSYNINRGSLNPFSELITLWNIANILKVLHPDLLHCFTIKPNIYGALAAKWVGIPRLILSVTGMGSFYIDPSYKSKLIKTIIELLYRIVCRISSKTLFQNHDDLNYFVNQAICPKDRAVLIRSSGVDTDYFNPENAHSASNAMLVKSMELENKTIVIMIARAIWHKGIREYYDAAKILQTQAPHIKMILVGGTDKGNLSCADETFLQNKDVLWLGERRDIKELIAISDIVALPSYREGVPRTLLEAASMGKPLITTNAIGCREVVDDGINGFLVPAGDAISLAEKIYTLAEDQDLQKRFGNASREKALKEFDAKFVVQQYLALYESCYSSS